MTAFTGKVGCVSGSGTNGAVFIGRHGGLGKCPVSLYCGAHFVASSGGKRL